MVPVPFRPQAIDRTAYCLYFDERMESLLVIHGPSEHLLADFGGYAKER